MIDTFVRVKVDRYWWTNCTTGFLVPFSRYQDDCWKFGKASTYPAPTKYFRTPLGGDNAAYLSPEWLKFIKDINPPKSFEVLMVIDAVLFNRPSNPQYITGDKIPYPPPEPLKAEGITSITNYHKAVEWKNGSTRIEAFDYKDLPPDPNIINQYTQPWMFHRVSSINREGDIGYAPKGEETWLPILAIGGQAWLFDEKLEQGVELPKDRQMPNIVRAWGADISKWNDIFIEDNIDEGLPPLSFVIQKAYDGTYDYTIEGNLASWKPQYDSIKHFEVKGGYGWYQTELDAIKQAETALRIAEKKLYQFIPVDFEAYFNVINEETANDLKTFVTFFKERSPLKMPVYTNGWINTMLSKWLGSWWDSQDLWFAGGDYYGLELPLPITDNIIPELPNGFTFWQLSGSKNKLADEWDFGQNEDADIDINIYKSDMESLLQYVGLSDTPPPDEPVDLYKDGWNGALVAANEKIATLELS